ncbi:lipoprotein-releasing system transmembrane protein LolE [mine drainage metagenome]|uniref:Lipoprotein-releasing system transmembrane protein LolE n=1 Tax=mine drainage metagenome TaxID=410659 RepID=A0A1J5SSB3_9ZZZZ
MNFLFAWRYFKSKKTTNAVNIIAWISVVAIAVGTAALIIVLSVFNGFEGLVKGLYVDFYADIRIAPASGKVLQLTQEQIDRIKKTNGVTQISLVAEEKAVLVNGDYQSIVFVKGVDENFTATNNITHHIVEGKYDLGTADAPKIVIGAGIENATGIDVEHSLYPVVLYLPNKYASNFNSLDAMNSYDVKPSGTFSVQQDFDNKYIFSNLPFLKYMLDMKADEYSSVEIKVAADKSNDVKSELQNLLGNKFLVQTRFEQNQSLFTVMQVEKWVIYGILSLILIVAAFNMIGALTMLVLEKQKDIAVLKAMGADDGLIQKIFLSEGFVLAGVGGAAGIILATIICIIQIKFHLIKLAGGTFIIDYYPVTMVATDFILVIITVSFIALLAAWIPSRKASLQQFSLKS